MARYSHWSNAKSYVTSGLLEPSNLNHFKSLEALRSYENDQYRKCPDITNFAKVVGDSYFILNTYSTSTFVCIFL